ncbi:MAG: helix-turn-helix domain-containing protein [Bacteroidota bacterium]
MNGKIPYQRIIFGLKIKQLRQEKGLSFAELAKATGMSVSYLNEIEKGKKFPKGDKISVLATTLNIEEEKLLSTEMGPRLAPVKELLQSNFLNELPLDLFGIELGKVAELIASAPLRVGAFISTLLELSRSYALREENFFFAALRAFLELNNNYFEDIEEVVKTFAEDHKLPQRRPFPPQVLADILEDKYDYEVINGGLDAYPEMDGLRSVYLPGERQLLLTSKLSSMQQSFQFGKEIGFHVLKLKERSYTSSILRPQIFEEVLNHAYATYFSVALHLPKEGFVSKLERFFTSPKWDAKAFVGIMNAYDASPEMFYHRLTNIIPRFFNMPKLFFLRFLHKPESDQFEIDRELHLSKRHHPHGNAILEHYCRRWVSLSLLQDLAEMQQDGKYVSTIVRAQRSRFLGTEDEYLCITLARPGQSENSSRLGGQYAQSRNISVTLGLLINEDVKRQIAWLDDPAIQARDVNRTCERCALTDCTERAVPPVIVQKRERLRAIENRLTKLNQE